MKDRRKHKREKISPHLKVLIPATGESFGAFITNLSEGGLEVYTDRKISEGSQVQLFLSFTSKAGQGKEEIVDGEVRWVKSSGTRFLVGTAFTEIDPARHPMLCDLLKFVD